MKTEILIQNLIEQTRLLINQAEKLKTQTIETLTWRAKQDSWNVLECIEHLNLYGDYYLPQIEKALKSNKTQCDTEFKSGILGNYFAKSMMPKDKLNKMKTFKDKNPLNTALNKMTLDRFINQQLLLIDLLNTSKNVSLNKIKITVSISNFLKLKLGDTYQFLINHNLRHFQQIEKIQEQMKNTLR